MKLSELACPLKQLELHPAACSIGTVIPKADETYCLVEENGAWLSYYAERGQRSDLREYGSEEEACSAFPELLKSDESVWRR